VAIFPPSYLLLQKRKANLLPAMIAQEYISINADGKMDGDNNLHSQPETSGLPWHA
jgi:hypothetical protein